MAILDLITQGRSVIPSPTNIVRVIAQSAFKPIDVLSVDESNIRMNITDDVAKSVVIPRQEPRKQFVGVGSWIKGSHVALWAFCCGSHLACPVTCDRPLQVQYPPASAAIRSRVQAPQEQRDLINNPHSAFSNGTRPNDRG